MDYIGVVLQWWIWGGGGGGGFRGQGGFLTPPPKISSISRSRYSNKAVTVLEQCVANYLKIFMYFISDKCIVGEVGSYFW